MAHFASCFFFITWVLFDISGEQFFSWFSAPLLSPLFYDEWLLLGYPFRWGPHLRFMVQTTITHPSIVFRDNCIGQYIQHNHGCMDAFTLLYWWGSFESCIKVVISSSESGDIEILTQLGDMACKSLLDVLKSSSKELSWIFTSFNFLALICLVVSSVPTSI